MEQDYDNYIVFILGADGFVRNRLFDKKLGLSVDQIYDICVEIARAFEKSPQNEGFFKEKHTALRYFIEEAGILVDYIIDLYSNRGMDFTAKSNIKKGN